MVCVLLVGHGHLFIKDFELFSFDWLFQSREKQKSCHKLLYRRNSFRNTEIHSKKILKFFVYQKCEASNPK